MIKVKKLNEHATLPTRSHRSAGYDLHSAEEATLLPGQVTVVHTGIAVEFPTGNAALVWDRSGMGKRGIHIFGGVVDEDYRGEWMCLMYNSTKQAYRVQIGDRIAQFVLQPVLHQAISEVEALTETDRAEAGFGSTGR